MGKSEEGTVAVLPHVAEEVEEVEVVLGNYGYIKGNYYAIRGNCDSIQLNCYD